MITINMVSEAMNSLKNDGLPTSVPRIRKILGSGSFATIQKFKKKLDAQQALEESINQIPHSNFELLQLDINNLRNIVNSLQDDIKWLKKNTTLENKTVQPNKKVEILNTKLDTVQNEAQKTINDLTQKLNDAKIEIARQTKDYNDLQAKYTTLKTATPKKTIQHNKRF